MLRVHPYTRSDDFWARLEARQQRLHKVAGPEDAGDDNGIAVDLHAVQTRQDSRRSRQKYGAPEKPGNFDPAKAHQKWGYSLRSRSRLMEWSASLRSTRVARGRVGRMFSTRLGRLIERQISRAAAMACGSLSRA